MDRVTILLLAILIGMVFIVTPLVIAQRTAPDPTVSQYVDTERGIVCYTYGSSGISCVRDE